MTCGVRLHVWGESTRFTRPEMKVECAISIPSRRTERSGAPTPRSRSLPRSPARQGPRRAAPAFERCAACPVHAAHAAGVVPAMTVAFRAGKGSGGLPRRHRRADREQRAGDEARPPS